MIDIRRRLVLKRIALGAIVLQPLGLGRSASDLNPEDLFSQSVLVKTRLFSLIHSDKRYSSPADFYDDHEEMKLNDLQTTSLQPLSRVAGSRISSGICETTGAPYFMVRYTSVRAYQAHIDLLLASNGIKKVEVSESELKYVSQDFFAVDEIQG